MLIVLGAIAHVSYNIFSNIQAQSSHNKNFFCSKKSKPKDQKPTPPYDNGAKLIKKKNKKNKKKKF